MKQIALVGMAREGSTRLKNKMIRPFGNTSLFEIYLHKFEMLKESDIFSEVVIGLNKNDTTLWNMGIKSTIDILSRSDKSVMGIQPMSITMDFLNKVDSDYIMWVNGCFPFLTLETIKNAATYFQKNDFESMTAVKEKYNWYWDAKTFEPINNKDSTNVYTQKSPPLLETVHCFHIYRKEQLLERDSYWNLKNNDPHLYIVKDGVEFLDIDDEPGFKVAKIIWGEQNQ